MIYIIGFLSGVIMVLVYYCDKWRRKAQALYTIIKAIRKEAPLDLLDMRRDSSHVARFHIHQYADDARIIINQ